jgi:glycosyltransferase involved in cell wall biosynthesis
MDLDIVIPAYKEEDWLPDLLDCFLSQNLADVQIYVSYSTDENGEAVTAIRHRYRSIQNLTILQTPPTGVSFARNRAANVGEGEWILFLDADVLLPDFFLAELRRTIQLSSSDALGFGFYADSFRASMRAGTRISYWYIRLLALLRRPVLPGFAILVRRNAFEKVGGFRDGLAMGEDYAFTEDLRRHGFSVALCSYPWILISVRRFEPSLAMAVRVFGQYCRVELARLVFGRRYYVGDIHYDFGRHIQSYKRRFPYHVKRMRLSSSEPRAKPRRR